VIVLKFLNDFVFELGSSFKLWIILLLLFLLLYFFSLNNILFILSFLVFNRFISKELLLILDSLLLLLYLLFSVYKNASFCLLSYLISFNLSFLFFDNFNLSKLNNCSI
jgi:hypothetical protein